MLQHCLSLQKAKKMKILNKRDKAKIKRYRVSLALELHSLWSKGHEIDSCPRIRTATALLLKAYEKV